MQLQKGLGIGCLLVISSSGSRTAHAPGAVAATTTTTATTSTTTTTTQPLAPAPPPATAVATPQATVNPLLTAFLGALVAFAFFLLGQAILKAYDNAVEHRNALVRLERLLNEQLDIIHVHVGQIGTLRANVEQGHLCWDLPRVLPVDEAVGFRLLDIDLVNRLFSLWALARRANTDVENLRSAYKQIADLFLGGRLKQPDYVSNGLSVVQGFETIADALGTYKVEAEDLLARVRFHVKAQQGIPLRFVRFLTMRLWMRARPLSDEDLKRELEQLAEEVRLVHLRESATNRKQG